MSARSDSAAPRMDGRTVLVTGGTAGIGHAAALRLAGLGATVLVTGRDPDRGDAAQRALREAGSPGARFLRADHSTPDGNLALASDVAASTPVLDVLINNVGGLIPTRRLAEDGTELTLAPNLRAAVMTTEQVRPLLARADAPLVVNLASDAYGWFTGDPFADLNSDTGYQAFEAYAHAKLLLVLATLAHARKLRPDGIRVFAVNPGMAWTPGTQAMTRDAVPAWRFVWPLVRAVQRRMRPDRAARVVALLASDPARIVGPDDTGRYVTSGGTVRHLGPLQHDAALQDRAMAVAHELGRSEHGTRADVSNAA